jgi:hypothetical protein
MNTVNESNYLEQIGLGALVPICFLSLALNWILGMIVIANACQRSTPEPKNLHQNISINYYAYVLDTKHLEHTENK